MNILYLDAHSILTFDELRLFHSLGHEVFDLGGYIEPAHPHDPVRGPLPDIPSHPELKAVVDALGTEDNLRAAKDHIPDPLLDWADVIICAAFEHTWLVPEWARLRDKRVIWRTIGQSVEHNERMMKPLFDDGLEIVRYSPNERNIPGYAGESALIRFAKVPEEWDHWVGDREYVLNVTQDLKKRHEFTNWRFWEMVTRGLARVPMGPGSDTIGGTGAVSEDRMKEALRRARAYLYCGTQPASYTLGFIEAGMTGVPIVSIGAGWHTIHGEYAPSLFEAPDFLPLGGFDSVQEARSTLEKLLSDRHFAGEVSKAQRATFVDTFGFDAIKDQWGQLLGSGVRELEAVAA